MVESLSDPLLGKDDRVEGGNGAEFDDSELERGIPHNDEKNASIVEIVDTAGKASFWQATINMVNILIGMGLIALPATFEEGGLLSLGLLLVFSVICCYTGALLGRVIENNPGLKNYPDIAGVACGAWGRKIVMVLIFFDIVSFLVGNTIALGDNLARIFPNAGVAIPSWGVTLEPSQVLVTIAIIVALPTTWLRDMSSLSLVSVGGVATSVVVIGALAWAGLFGGVGFHHSPPLLNVWNLPIVSGIYAYCYAGHNIIPNIYSGMANPAQFPRVLIVAFAITSTIYGATAILGVTMFGEGTMDQITLNIPKNLVASDVALWTTVLTPLSKYGLGVAVAAEQIDNFLPFSPNSRTFLTLSTCIRTFILFSILATAIAMPYFHDMLALLGAVFAMTMAITLPAFCNLRIFGRSLSRLETCCSAACIVIGVFFTIVGTATSLRALRENFSA